MHSLEAAQTLVAQSLKVRIRVYRIDGAAVTATCRPPTRRHAERYPLDGEALLPPGSQAQRRNDYQADLHPAFHCVYAWAQVRLRRFIHDLLINAWV